MNGKPRSLLAIEDLSVEEIDGLLHTALDIIDRPAAYADVCRGKSWRRCSLSRPPARG